MEAARRSHLLLLPKEGKFGPNAPIIEFMQDQRLYENIVLYGTKIAGQTMEQQLEVSITTHKFTCVEPYKSNLTSIHLNQNLSMSIGINIYSVCTNAEPYIHICIEFTAKLKFLENSNLIKANVRANLQLFT